jgi:hypothetical protein
VADNAANGRPDKARLSRVRHGLVGGLRRIGLAQPALPPAPDAGPPGSTQALDETELAKRHAALAARFAQLQWDLGGLVYEMASRDHFRLDLVMTRAAELQEVESELAQAERLLRLEHAGAAGACPSCGSLYAHGAVFCSHCGLQLLHGRGDVAGATGPGDGRGDDAGPTGPGDPLGG